VDIVASRFFRKLHLKCGFAGELTRLNYHGQFKPFIYLNPWVHLLQQLLLASFGGPKGPLSPVDSVSRHLAVTSGFGTESWN
jgi:hypothetical protein